MCVDCFKQIISYLDINLYEDSLVQDSRVLNYWKHHTKYTEEKFEDKQIWYRNRKRHRDGDLPAIVRSNGTQEWWRNGERHRDGDLPAIVWRNGTQWWRNGEMVEKWRKTPTRKPSFCIID